MDGDRTERALSRIDAALARLEAAAIRLDEGQADLEAHNHALRQAAAQAMQRIDALLAGQQPS